MHSDAAAVHVVWRHLRLAPPYGGLRTHTGRMGLSQVVLLRTPRTARTCKMCISPALGLFAPFSSTRHPCRHHELLLHHLGRRRGSAWWNCSSRKQEGAEQGGGLREYNGLPQNRTRSRARAGVCPGTPLEEREMLLEDDICGVHLTLSPPISQSHLGPSGFRPTKAHGLVQGPTFPLGARRSLPFASTCHLQLHIRSPCELKSSPCRHVVRSDAPKHMVRKQVVESG